MKKAFTLIELLSVIIILAVIALIATPIVLNVVESSRKSAFESSAYGVLDAIRLKSMEHKINNESLEKEYLFPNTEIEVQGSLPKGGIAKVDEEGRITLAVYNEKWCATKGYDSSEIKVKKYNSVTCTLEEDVIYYGFIDEGDYTVSLSGQLIEYRGSELKTIPQNFSGESYYNAINISKCREEWVSKIGYIPGQYENKLSELCYVVYNSFLANLFDVSDWMETKIGYIEYRNIEVDASGCQGYLEAVEDTYQLNQYDVKTRCTLENLYNEGHDLNTLYESGAIKADRKIVEKYKKAYDAIEGFDYILNKDAMNEEIKDSEVSLEMAYVMLESELFSLPLTSRKEMISQLETDGIVTKKHGYYIFKDIVFNVEKCKNMLTELGVADEELENNCNYEYLNSMGISNNTMLELGFITANKETFYENENQFISVPVNEISRDSCISFALSSGETSDEQTIEELCYSNNVYLQSSKEETDIHELYRAGLILSAKDMAIFENISVNTEKCLALASLNGFTGDELNSVCTIDNITQLGSLKFLYDFGMINADEVKVEKYSNEENDVNRTIGVIKAIGNGVFAEKSISGELDLTYLEELERIDAYAFENNQITSIKLPKSIKMIGPDAFYFNLIAGNLDLSYLENLTTVGGFSSNQIENIELPNSVTVISHKAFSNNQFSGVLDLRYLTNLKDISGFSYNNIDEVLLSTSIVQIGRNAFDFAGLNGTLDLSNLINLEQIGKFAFNDNNISGILDLSKCDKLEILLTNAFADNKLEKVVIPNSVREIDSSAFEVNSVLTSIVIDNVKGSLENEPWGTGAIVTYLRTE